MEIDNSYPGMADILREDQKKTGLLIQALQEIQRIHNYLPPEELDKLSQTLGISQAEVYSAASFYKSFHFKPRGKNIICVCMGTACHVRGASKALQKLSSRFGIEPGETTEDLSVTLETVGCVGCCGLAPVVTVNDEIIGEVDDKKVSDIANSLKTKTMPGG